MKYLITILFIGITLFFGIWLILRLTRNDMPPATQKDIQQLKVEQKKLQEQPQKPCPEGDCKG